MIRHIVMWDVRGATAEERVGNIELLRRRFHALRGRIPGLLQLEVGVDSSGVDDDCDVVLDSEFESQAALDAYARHPEHLRVRATLKKSSRVWAPWFGMGCKAQTTAIAPLWRGFATPQTAQNRDDRAARDLFRIALGRTGRHPHRQAPGELRSASRSGSLSEDLIRRVEMAEIEKNAFNLNLGSAWR